MSRDTPEESDRVLRASDGGMWPGAFSLRELPRRTAVALAEAVRPGIVQEAPPESFFSRGGLT